jgi:hypothetical protein
MRYLLVGLLILTVCGLNAQGLATGPNVNYHNVFGTFYKASTGPATNVLLQGRTISSTSSDTTTAVQIADFKTIYVGMQVKDTCTVLMYYATSVDDSTYSPYTLIDSLSARAVTGGEKYVDMTSTLKGAKSFKCVFAGSNKAYTIGDTPTFKVRYFLKKY